MRGCTDDPEAQKIAALVYTLICCYALDFMIFVSLSYLLVPHPHLQPHQGESEGEGALEKYASSIVAVKSSQPPSTAMTFTSMT